ncbi:pyruvate formate lyase family protein [Desulfoluna spongiiphila]|uniref:pyruvate formate lyase family protein n=1 Tax=Desulfoluna spongiiphila TaxID=419481 RepID=UPI00125147CA|nr:pyruvate formate lyase family protein [Desulfoluna spongiiphila]VVS93927.1 pyruvate formate lyase domain [Desulfoluna spongiiphila]
MPVLSFARRVFTPNRLTRWVLTVLALGFRVLPHVRNKLKSPEGWMDFSVGVATKNGSVAQALVFQGGQCRVVTPIPARVDACLTARDEKSLAELVLLPPSEVMVMMLKNRIRTSGNLAYIQLVNRLVALLAAPLQERILGNASVVSKLSLTDTPAGDRPEGHAGLARRTRHHLTADAEDDPGVRHLKDPYLSRWDLGAFPRIEALLARHLKARPRICPERAEALTAWHRKNGYETKPDGTAWHPVERQGLALAHVLKSKKPVVATDQLLAGTTTSDPVCGVAIYPDTHGTSLWSELDTVHRRELNPYDISPYAKKALHDLFPFWIHRNVREQARSRLKDLTPLEIDEKWVAYFCWKSVGVSHTAPDFHAILSLGTTGLREKIKEGQGKPDLSQGQAHTLRGMSRMLDGLDAYAEALSREAVRCAAEDPNPAREKELTDLARVCAKVPRHAATTLHEALQCLWTTWIALNMENTDTGLSMGRLDRLLQPFFLSDMAQCTSREERNATIEKALELCCAFFLRLTDHMPMSPDIGNHLFGGSPPDQAVTLGGVTPQGEDGVCDMTYILLKVTEMLSIHDPNVNARIHPEKNSVTYIKRLCEVNYTTGATPSLHNDLAVAASLAKHGYPEEHANDWCAIGCVEPTLTGRHAGHTGSILMNLVAGLEMALNNGVHPLIGTRLGPRTGSLKHFTDFEAFFTAWKTQQRFLIENAVTLNNTYAALHAEMRPTPLLSILMDGCLAAATDITQGGARYNSSGTSNIGLADVTDSLLAVKKLVFDDKRLTLSAFKEAVDTRFTQAPQIRELVRNHVPLFGSGSDEAISLCNEITRFLSTTYHGFTNHRGGPYTCGFWSMSQHVAYGALSGTLPSGRLAGKAFTPGLTPEPHASANYLDFISDVARLDPTHMDNNIAFNVKLVPKPGENRQKIVDTMAAYVTAYLGLGGMQMQFNVVDSSTLKDAMARPEHYPNLIVRISGYNAYFVRLNHAQQIELIERAEYGMAG